MSAAAMLALSNVSSL